MATGPWDSFKTQQAETSEPQEQGPWTQFAVEKPAEAGAPWTQFAKAEPKPEDQSFLRSVADVPLKAVSGLATGVRLVADAFGAGSGVSNTIKGVEDYIGDLYSAQSKKDSAEISRIMKDAEDKGVGDQVKAAIKAFTVAPIDTVVNALGTSAPAIVAGLGASVLGAGAAAATAVGAGVGATMGAGTIKGSIYDAVKEELNKTDMSADQIEARAQLAQNYNGKNLDQILMGSALGAVGAATGFEPAVARQVAKQIITNSVKKQAAVTGLKEFAGEAAQGGQEQLAQNIALQREGYDVPTMRGVVGQATLEGLAGAGLGATAGAREGLEGRRAAAERDKLVSRAEEQPAPTPEASPVEERVAARVQELEQQGYMKEDAAAIAVKNIADEDAQARAPEVEAAVADVTPDAERVDELTTQFQEQFNLSKEEAQATAVELATEEAKEDAIAQREATGAADVGEPIAEAGGVSPELVGQPDQIAPTTGAGEPTTDGMVPTGENVAPTVAGEAVEPTALAEAQPVEGAPVGVETLEAVQAETQGQELAPAPTEVIEEEAAVAEEEPKGKRGRTPLAPEERAAKEAERKAYRAAYTKAERTFSQGKNNIVNQLELANQPLNEGEFANEDEFAQAQEDKRAEKADAIKRLVEVESQFRGSALGNRAKALLNDRTKITEAELAKVKRGIEIRKKTDLNDLRGVSEKGSSILAQNTSMGTPDADFSKAKNGAQALARVLKTGDAFQKLLAVRLRPFVNGVKFVVLEKNDPVPAQLQSGRNAEAWANARGVYIQNDAAKTKTVYVRGASFGEDQGVNNVTVLHELLHAATNQKIELGMLASAKGFSSDAKITRFVEEINGLADYAKNVYEYAVKNNIALPDGVKAIVQSTKGEVFYNPKEFVAYGMSDPAFQQFLNKLQGRRENGFSRFVHAILRLFGLGDDKFTALSDLVDLTDQLLSARKTPTMELVEKGMPDEEEISASAKQTVSKTEATTAKLKKSSFADNIRDNIPLATSLRDGNKFADVLSVNTKNWGLGTLRQLLPALQTQTIVDWASRVQVGNDRGIPGIKESWKATGDMLAMRNKLTNAMGEINEKINTLSRKDRAQFRKLADVMHFSTLISKDPTTNKTNSALNRMWGELTEANQKLYEQVRDFYKNNHELYHHLLDEQISQSDMDPDTKGKLIAQIKKMYEDGKKLYPYFPLMRYGQFWVRVGKGKDGEFHMFESAADRDYFVLERVRQLNATGDKRTKAEMMQDLDLDEGNDLSNARRNDTSASDMLKKIFNSIDEAEKGGKVEAEPLKDEIYQLYLQTLPDRNFRRQYLKRQGKAGFSGDIQRNFINSGLNVANQLSRIKYGPKIMGELDRAQNSLEGNPDKARLGEFISEMRLRAEQQVRPDPESGAWFAAAKLANTSAFLWMMTSVKTMVAQFTAIPIFVGPVLGSKYGEGKTALALGKSLNVFNGLGIKDKDGNLVPPSMANLKGLTADEKLAAQFMHDRGISDTTLAFDLGNRRDIPTAIYNGKAREMFRLIPNAMTAMFHHAERMIREVTFMSAYRLNREAGKTHEQALEQAEADTHEALNNYHASNRPRGILADSERRVMLDAHKPLGRAVLQFKMFPAFVTTYFVRNFYRMTRDMDPQVRKEARKQFIGSLGMSFALAGYVGIPGISFAMGIAQGLLNSLRGEDDDDDLEKRNLEFWFRNKWMPDTFGNVKIGDRNLAELLDRGLITSLTGYDITSSLSMNNMWLPEQKDQATLTGEIQSLFVSMMGPGASLAFTQLPKGIDYFNQGKILQGMEQWAPALFRGSLTAYRYGQEGATTSSGAVIKDKDEFTAGQLMAQRAGFVTEGLQARREAIFALQGEILKVKQERTSLLTRLDNEINNGSDDAVETAFDKIIRFNSRNPMDAIDADNISQSMQKHMKRRLNSDRGFPLDAKYYPFVMDLLEPSGVKLDREEKAARK
jgi:hypothetical protein